MNEIASSFSFLDGSLNVLMIDDDIATLELYKDILSFVPLYSVDCAVNAEQAQAFFKSGKRLHVCVHDLGIYDKNNDELNLLKKYSSSCSFVIATGSNSPLKGARCIQSGARDVLEKGSFGSKEFIEVVNHNALINIINKNYSEMGSESFNIATKVLLENRPGSVTEWAEYMQISDRQLRNIWQDVTGFSAKQILSVSGLFMDAFKFYQILNFGTDEEKNATPSIIDVKKWHSFYSDHKQTIMSILSIY